MELLGVLAEEGEYRREVFEADVLEHLVLGRDLHLHVLEFVVDGGVGSEVDCSTSEIKFNDNLIECSLLLGVSSTSSLNFLDKISCISCYYTH